MPRLTTGKWSKRASGALALFAGVALSAIATQPAAAQSKQLTLCWAAWDPANALVELGKDFTKETGIEMKYEFVPWTSYADRFLNELNSHGKLCDLIIGDSQWIGGAAENHWYVKLNDFFAKEHISMADFVPATVVGYSEWPKNTDELLGAAGHGRRGRLDLSQGLVLPAGDPSRVQEANTAATSLRPRPMTNSSRSPSSSRAARSTARRSMAPTSSPSAARKASPWA